MREIALVHAAVAPLRRIRALILGELLQSLQEAGFREPAPLLQRTMVIDAARLHETAPGDVDGRLRALLAKDRVPCGNLGAGFFDLRRFARPALEDILIELRARRIVIMLQLL